MTQGTTPPEDPHAAALHGLPVAADPENFRAREPLEVLITRFSEAVRRGEQPSIEDYATRYAAWADQIRDLFPLIQSLEHWKSDKELECLRRGLPDELPIRQLGRYRLLRELGRGGMGVVFEAIDDATGRHRAVKLLPWRYASGMAQWKDQFQREARTIAGLRHANIVRVEAYGTHEGYCYYVMDLIAGISLDRIIRRLRETPELNFADEIHRAGRDLGSDGGAGVPPAPGHTTRHLRRDSWYDMANIALPVALALAHAHEAGVLHNDIKPANLLLDGAGNVIVTDFGIARRMSSPGEQTTDEQTTDDKSEEHQVGTLRYMAPERLRGVCDGRSDVYSLGATLYELVTQTPAFAAEDRRQVMELILQGRVTPPRQLAPDLPRPLELITLNALQPDPNRRYPSAAALASDLLRFVNGLSIADRRPGLFDRTRRWFSRKH